MRTWTRCGRGLLLLIPLALGCGGSDSDTEPVAEAEEPESGFDEDRVRRCAPGETLKGIDVSYHQGQVDWRKARRDGVVFAFARVADGPEVLDTEFARNWAGMRDAGVVRGAYQFFRPGRD